MKLVKLEHEVSVLSSDEEKQRDLIGEFVLNKYSNELTQKAIVSDLKQFAPTPIFRPRIGFFKVEPAMSQFRVMTALRPSVPDAVTECSPSPKGRPVGPRAQRSNGISSLAFISCLLHIQIPLRVSRCPAPNVSSRCCSSQNISPTLGAMRARRRNLLGTRSRTSPSTTAAQ